MDYLRSRLAFGDYIESDGSGISARSFSAALEAAAAEALEIDILFDSNGGNVAETKGIVQAMDEVPHLKRGFILRDCNSCASIALTGCGSIYMHPEARIVIHDPWAELDTPRTAEAIRADREWMLDRYCARWPHISRDQWAQWTAVETHFSAHDAMSLGLIDGLLDANVWLWSVGMQPHNWEGVNRPWTKNPVPPPPRPLSDAQKRWNALEAEKANLQAELSRLEFDRMLSERSERQQQFFARNPLALPMNRKGGLVRLPSMSSEVKAAISAGDKFRCHAQRTAAEVELGILDEIGTPGTMSSAAAVVAFLRANRGVPVVVRINSMGGLAYDGVVIHNALSQHDAKVTTRIEGQAASAASIIAMAGDEVEMFGNASFMLHRALLVAVGNRDVMEEARVILDQLDKQLAATYAAKTGRTQAEMMRLMIGQLDGTTMDAETALKWGFVTKVLPVGNRRGNRAALDGIRRQLRAQFQAA